MIIIKIELHSARTGKVTELGRTIIANTGKNEKAGRGDYAIFVARKGTENNTEILTNPLRKGTVKNYPGPSYNVWRLVIRGLKSAFPEEK